MSQEACFLFGVLPAAVFRAAHGDYIKRPVVVYRKQTHAAKSGCHSVEPEVGRMIQTQVNHLVIGVEPRPARLTLATRARRFVASA